MIYDNPFRRFGYGVLVCAVTGSSFISLLHKLNFGQSIRECGPKEHMKKAARRRWAAL